MKTSIVGAFCAGILLSAMPAAAQSVTGRTNIYMVVEKNRSLDGAKVTAGEDEAVITTTARSPRAVRLKEPVTIGVLGTAVDVPADTILYGRFDKSVWTYCTATSVTAESRIASEAAAAVLTAGFTLLLLGAERGKSLDCLFDEDSDGKFDSAWGGSAVANEESRVAFSFTERTMATKPAYERVPGEMGPGSTVELKWNKPKNEAKIHFSLLVGGDKIASEAVSIPAAGAKPEEFNIMGATFTLESYDSTAKRITINVKEGFSDFYARVPAVQTITYY